MSKTAKMGSKNQAALSAGLRRAFSGKAFRLGARRVVRRQVRSSRPGLSRVARERAVRRRMGTIRVARRGLRGDT